MNHQWAKYLKLIHDGDFRSLARCISLIENEVKGYEDFLASLEPKDEVKITGITGPPGAGKSTLADALIESFVSAGKKIAVLCVDPSSPFNMGALLGDRIRMSAWYNHPNVFIRSLATRGSLGGLHPRIIEITELLRSAMFDVILVETVGVGQSEVEITGLADTTIVVLVPESGDEIQTMKAGLMEIADIFVVNKADRPEAAAFVKNLKLMMAPSFKANLKPPAIVETVGIKKTGIETLVHEIALHQSEHAFRDKRSWLLTEKAFHLLQKQKMKGFDKAIIKQDIDSELAKGRFNLYQFVRLLQEKNS